MIARVVDTITAGSPGAGSRVMFDTILAGYVGHVDVGMALTGIEGSMPYGLHQWGDNAYSGPAPQRTARGTAAELRDDPKGVTMSLIRRFLDATRGTSYVPFEEPKT